MTTFQAFAIASGLSAFCGVLAIRLFRVGGSQGLTLAGAAVSLAAYLVGGVFPAADRVAKELWVAVNFQEAVFHGMLCFLLFAGAMHVDLPRMRKWVWHIGLLATVGVVVSALVVAGVLWLAASAFGVAIPFSWLLVFGALISPTDPIAVLALLKKVGAPRDLETKIAAESLFNDGTGVVMFAVLVAAASSAAPMGAGEMAWLFAREAGGGLALGGLVGFLGHKAVSWVDDAPTETAMTIALALCLYAGAEALHVSAPLAVATAGVVIGNGKRSSMSEETRARLLPFWSMLDEILNIALFALVGLALMAAEFSVLAVFAGAAAVVASLAGRAVSVSAGLGMLRGLRDKVAPGTVTAMTWGGLRGGLSLAMALGMPEGEWKGLMVTSAWFVVMFSLLVQAPTMGAVLKKTGVVG